VEPRFNKVPGITNNILLPGQGYSKMHGAVPQHNEPQHNKISDITNRNQKPKVKSYPHTMNKCHYMTEVEGKTDETEVEIL